MWNCVDNIWVHYARVKVNLAGNRTTESDISTSHQNFYILCRLQLAAVVIIRVRFA